MRTAIAAGLLLLAPLLAAAQQPPIIEVEVGKELRLGGSMPNCDDPGVAWISADGAGILHGVKEGKTICSVGLGQRRVYRVHVVPPRAKDGGKAKSPGGGPGGA